MGFRFSSPPSVDRIWPWVYHKKIPINPMFYLLEADYRFRVLFGAAQIGVEAQDELALTSQFFS